MNELRQKFAATAHFVMAVQALDVDVHGVLAEVEVGGDLFFAVAREKPLERLLNPR
jgi:hypothetical protein